MSPKPGTKLQLYAVVPAEDGSTLEARARGLSTLSCGRVAAVFGRPPSFDDEVRAAVWHDRVVELAFENCSSVVPFRLGIALASEAELLATLDLNVTELSRQLARFEGRVEMGLKLRLAAADDPLRAPSAVSRVRALAPAQGDRSERLVSIGPGRIFAGCYLISRKAVQDFWRALDTIRRLSPDLPLVGTGPWAAYSFCDVPLRHVTQPARSAPEIS